MNLYKNSFDKIKENKKSVVKILVVEFIFIVLIFTSGIFVYNNLLDSYDLIQDLTAQLPQGQTREEFNLLQGDLLLLNSTLDRMLRFVSGYVMLFLVVTTIFLGYSSYLIGNFVNKKKINWKYFAKFLGLALLWLLIIGFVMFKGESFQNQMLLWGVLVVIGYFATVSFATYLKNYNLKEAVGSVYEVAIKKFSKIFLHYLVGMGVFLFIAYFLTLISENVGGFSIIGALFLILVFVWFRVLMIEVCGRQDSNLRKH